MKNLLYISCSRENFIYVRELSLGNLEVKSNIRSIYVLNVITPNNPYLKNFLALSHSRTLRTVS